MWAARAIAEWRNSPRTWFGTLTFSPQAHMLALSRARVRLSRQGIDYDALPVDEQFQERHRELSPEVTRYLKRVRKVSGPLRFLIVAEAHVSGLPHYHLLCHEQDADRPVRKRTLQAQWAQNGFSSFKLVEDPQAASYVCKYVGKSAAARVRASARYGSQTVIDLSSKSHERVMGGSGGTPPVTELANEDEEFASLQWDVVQDPAAPQPMQGSRPKEATDCGDGFD